MLKNLEMMEKKAHLKIVTCTDYDFKITYIYGTIFFSYNIIDINLIFSGKNMIF